MFLLFQVRKSYNNKMERINGEIRDREKVMRGLKIKETPILQGMQIYHNFIKPHEGLAGKTPSEACGIELIGENKWLTLIQNASMKTKTIWIPFLFLFFKNFSLVSVYLVIKIFIFPILFQHIIKIKLATFRVI